MATSEFTPTRELHFLKIENQSSAAPPDAIGSGYKRLQTTSKGPKQVIPLALRSALMTSEPTDLPQETTEFFLNQVDTQLSLVKSLSDNVCLDEALKVQRLIHDRLKELAHLGDACIANWTTFDDCEDVEEQERKRAVLAASELSEESDTLKATQLSRWTKEEVDLFNLAIQTVDFSKRGYPEKIRAIVSSRSVVQIRERLRRIKPQKRTELREVQNIPQVLASSPIPSQYTQGRKSSAHRGGGGGGR